ncbi:MAG: acyl-ACP thioesterase domain-containing protein [Bdellovibrionota bacterium]
MSDLNSPTSNATGSKHYEINSFLVNTQKRLGLYSLLNILQDASWTHAMTLGHGHDASLARKTFWVLTRQHLVMKRWPAWGENLEIETWIRPMTGAIATRDFTLSIGGERIGEATTGWILLDADSRRPIKDGAASIEFEARVEGVLTLETPKILPIENATAMAKFQVRNSDIDMNDHVNNTKYAQWILDAMPIEWHRRYRLEDYQINFLTEAKLGDAVEVQFAALEGDETSDRTKLLFQGLRESDRKPIFTALLESSRLF